MSASGCRGICEGYCNFSPIDSRGPVQETTANKTATVSVALICVCCGAKWGYTTDGQQAFSRPPQGDPCPKTAEKIAKILSENQTGCEEASGGADSAGCSGSSTTT